MLAAEQLSPGMTFGSYEIARLLGKGSFGSVYEALKMPLRRRVALKLLHQNFTSDQKIVGRFLREAEAAAKLHHPHIVETFDVGVVDGAPFIAMEFLEGESLKNRLVREGALSITDTADILLPVLSAIATVHEAGIIHRDLKPENIQLEQRLGVMHPKVLDFGIAKIDDQRNLSAVGTKLGSPLYMSPEQHDGLTVDTRSDIWAMGVVLFQCGTGRPPFHGANLPQLYRKVVMEPTPSMRLSNPGIPAAFEAIVQRALQKDPANRFQTAREMGAALFPFASPVVQAALQREFGMNVQLSASGVHLANHSDGSGSTVVWDGPANPAGSASWAEAPRRSQPGSVDDRASVFPTGHPGPAPLASGSPVPPPMVAVSATMAPLPSAAPSGAAPDHRSKILVAVAVALLLVSAIIAAVALTNRQPAQPQPARPAVSAGPTTLRVRMTARPENASLQLDTHPAVIGSLDVSMPDDGRSHTLRISAPGHEPQSFTFTSAVPPPTSVVLAPLPSNPAMGGSPSVAAPPRPPPPVERSPVQPTRPRYRNGRDSIGNL